MRSVVVLFVLFLSVVSHAANDAFVGKIRIVSNDEGLLDKDGAACEVTVEPTGGMTIYHVKSGRQNYPVVVPNKLDLGTSHVFSTFNPSTTTVISKSGSADLYKIKSQNFIFLNDDAPPVDDLSSILLGLMWDQDGSNLPVYTITNFSVKTSHHSMSEISFEYKEGVQGSSKRTYVAGTPVGSGKSVENDAGIDLENELSFRNKTSFSCVELRAKE